MYQIIKASIENIPDIQNIAQITWRHTYVDIIPGQQLEFMLEHFYNESQLNYQISNEVHYHIIIDGEEKMGFIAYEKQVDLTVKIHKIYILPTHQRKGLGKMLIDQCINFTNDSDITKITLNVNRNNKAINFYQHLGFEISHQRDVPLPHGYFMYDYVMELKV
jgi:ribosomal protein S18 acetylase RimI-like enzyme